MASAWSKIKSSASKAAKAVSDPVATTKSIVSAAPAKVSTPSMASIGSAAIGLPGAASVAGKMPSLPDIGRAMPGPIGDALGMGGAVWDKFGGKIEDSFKRDPKVTYGTDMATPEMKAFRQDELVGLGTVRDMTKAPGSNPWIGMAKQNQQLQTQQAQNQLGAQQMGAQNQAMSNLAMRGGLRGGAAERMAKSGAQSQMMANQALAGQNLAAQSNIDIQGEQMRQQMLGAQMGAEQNLMGAQNQFNLKEYEEKMKLKGGAMTAQAIENAARAPGLGQTMLNPMYK